MDKRDLFTKIITGFLILMFFGGIALGAVNVLSAEGQEPPAAEYQASQKSLPKSKEEIVAYLNSCVNYAKAEKAKLDIHTGIAVEDSSISFGKNGDLLAESLKYAKDSILNNVSSRYPAVSIDFGKDFSGKIWDLNYDKNQIAKADSKEKEENYTFSLVFPVENNPFGNRNAVNDSFHMAEAKDMLTYMQKSYEDLADIKNADAKCICLEVSSTVNRLTGKISNITFLKKFAVKADAQFQEPLSAAGTKQLTFVFEVKTEFNFTWASIKLEPQTLQMGKGDTKVISAVVTASQDIPVEWVSSAPEVVSVDNEGYVKGHAISEKPVIITATFRFLGKTYSDTCEVYVTVPVKKVKISEKKLTLAKGEIKKLVVSVKPKDATIKDILWKSNNPSVATVDKNGKVTAVSKGETDVYALSKDGYYKISCSVTVTG